MQSVYIHTYIERVHLYIYVCMNANLYTHAHTRTHARTQTAYMHNAVVHISTYTSTHMQVYMHNVDL